MEWPKRLSFHQFAAGDKPFDDMMDALIAARVPRMAFMHGKVVDYGVAKAAKIVKDAGIHVTSIGQAGRWAGQVTKDAWQRNQSENIRVLDDAVALGAEFVSVGVGAMVPGDRDLRSARQRVIDGVRELAPHAAERKVKLALEIAHPLFVPDVSILSTLREAIALTDAAQSDAVGILVDTKHVWWDAELVPELKRAGKRVFLLQINDVLPFDKKSSQRIPNASIGEGLVDYAAVLEGLEAFTGWFEAEVIDDELRGLAMPALLERITTTYQNTIGRYLAA